MMKMVSRRRILSRSRDELHSADFYQGEQEQDDIWLNKEQLYQDHIQEVMGKWESIDDEIWAKIIVLERNRRVAKAYARAPVLTVNGSDDGFDGFRIGVAGFENPMRDAATVEAIRYIGQGFKLKMDNVGNILIKRVSKATVRVKNTTEESAVSNDILKLPSGALEMNKPFKVFDMKKFQQNMSRELKRPYPDRKKLEAQCISVVAFGSNTQHMDILDCPLWVLCINIVAIEMLRSKLPTIAVRPRPRSMEPHSLMSNVGLRPFGSGSSDEDPYSVAGSGSSGSSGENRAGQTGGMGHRSRSKDKPPKLPPRDNAIYGPNLWARDASRQSMKQLGKQGDDPYYCGLRARIPNFVMSKKKPDNNNNPNNLNSEKVNNGNGKKKQQSNGGLANSSKIRSQSSDMVGGPMSLPPQIPSHPFWWHSRLYSSDSSSQGPMSLMTPSEATSNNGGHYRRNPTNFVPYITANGNEITEDFSY